MMSGFTQCWWPSATCQVWWEAWASVGTIIAALMTLGAVIAALKTNQKTLDQARTIEDERRKTSSLRDARAAEAICKALMFETANALTNRAQTLSIANSEQRSEFTAKTLLLRLSMDTRYILKMAADRVEILPSTIAHLVYEDLAGAEGLLSFVRPTGRAPDNIDENQINPIYEHCAQMGGDVNGRDYRLITAIADHYQLDSPVQAIDHPGRNS